jgi:hypothetical protein
MYEPVLRVLLVVATSEVTQPQSDEFVRSTGYANPGAARKALGGFSKPTRPSPAEMASTSG